MCVYFYSLHVSGSHVPIIRRIIVSMRHLVYVTLCKCRSSMQEHTLLHTRPTSTHWHKPGVALIQSFSWWWAHGCLKHIENKNKHTWKVVLKVGYLQGSCYVLCLKSILVICSLIHWLALFPVTGNVCVTKHWDPFMQPLLQCKSSKYCVFRECVFVALGSQHAMRMRHIVICGLAGSTIFFHIVS